MSSLGGRPACSADFTVKVNDSTGEITDMKVHTTVDAGFDKSGGVTLIFKYTNHNAYVVFERGVREYHLRISLVLLIHTVQENHVKNQRSNAHSIVTNTGTLSDCSILI